ncbi:MAG: translocation/assembly module TamB domain-containing protein, partial [Chitinophagales bacterium]
AGDKLQVKGNGSFNYDINPTGKMTLTGRYEISDGSYNLTLYNVIRKQFILDRGSSITWTGEVLDANIDMKGHLDVRTSPFALVGSQVGGVTDAQQAQYKDPLDFDVFLIMQSKLLAPQISFDIQLDEKDKGALDGIVDARLAELQKQEGEMNKQVFALLVLGTFVAEDPNASTGASAYISDVARSSVSSMLSGQLNKLSSQYIKGVDINFDLKSVTDYSSGIEEEKTELNIGIREQLFNERLQIYVGTNFDIGGSTVFSTNPSDLSGDFSLEYLATPDGRIRLNLFRKDSYEGIFEDQTVESGVSVIYNRDYNSLRQLFISRREAVAEKRKKKNTEENSPKTKGEGNE